MTLTPSARFGPYEVIAAIGAGGMGEVYRARDTRLKREVALKILPPSFASDPDRIARFQREAEVLASLNHPNIGAIHGLEEADGTRALVMELVEGETLADRIARGPVPIDEALPIARQIAEALEAAHEQGIIHRDLKPANIKLRPDGTVKVLDFGLAKLNAPNGPNVSNDPNALSLSPTITSPALMTGVGVLLGTAAYMSPEQAKGRPGDKRSDIWAFGCVLYEMLTGTQPFRADDVMGTLALTITSQPAWDALPANTPPRIRELLRRCLAKNRRDRLADAADARLDLVAAAEPAQPDENDGRTSRALSMRTAWMMATGVAITAGVLGTILGVTFTGRGQSSDGVYRASLLLVSNSNTPITGLGAANVTAERMFALSPDGKRLAFVAAAPNGGSAIWIRSLDGTTASPLPGTENADSPFWSPDSRVLGFFANGGIKKIVVSGGPPITLVADVGLGGGATWNRQDIIVFSDTRSLYRVSASGGAPVVIAKSDDETYRWPYFLPDGGHYLYRGTNNQTYVRSLERGEPKPLGAGSNTQYANDCLVFVRGTTLMAQPFDIGRLEVVGEAVPIAEQLRSGTAANPSGAFSVSQNGLVVYETGSAASRFTWFTRSGISAGMVGDVGSYQTMALSPDGKKLVYGRRENGGGGSQSLWVADLSRNLTTRLTFTSSVDGDGTWSPDSSKLVYASTRKGDKSAYEIPASGGADRLVLKAIGQNQSIDDWSPDGRFLLFHTDLPRQLWALPMGSDPKPFVVAKPSSGFIDEPSFSPNGKWIAFDSDESGRYEVYLTTFPASSGKWQVSGSGGVQPTWRKDGRELYFLGLDGTLFAVDVHSDAASPEIGAPHGLFRTNVTPSGQVDQYAPASDGTRFLVMNPIDNADQPPTVLVNWPALVKP
jgi:eukaryotic-like serine/threonine-protein kinase